MHARRYMQRLQKREVQNRLTKPTNTVYTGQLRTFAHTFEILTPTVDSGTGSFVRLIVSPLWLTYTIRQFFIFVSSPFNPSFRHHLPQTLTSYIATNI